MTTFADLGLPFPLFEADVSEASEYRGIGDCLLCRFEGVHCFELGIGADIIANCSHCGTAVALAASDRENTTCSECKSTVAFPAFVESELRACYSCLRAGRAALTKSTQFGMVRWEDAQQGRTHGVPWSLRCDFEVVQMGEDWYAASMPGELLFELVRTPNYLTIQEERWQFCCKRPMTYIGPWERSDFDRHSPTGEGRKLFDQIVEEPVEGLWEDELHDITGIYVFVCKTCQRPTAHWDIA